LFILNTLITHQEGSKKKQDGQGT